MRIQYVIAPVLLLGLLNACITRKKSSDDDILNYKPKCSEVLDIMSYYWKLDSLPSNGYRKETYPIFSRAIIDSVHYNYVLEKFGNPNSFITDTVNNEIILEYRVYDYHKMPANFDGIKGYDAIRFKFDAESKLLKRTKTTYGKYRD